MPIHTHMTCAVVVYHTMTTDVESTQSSALLVHFLTYFEQSVTISSVLPSIQVQCNNIVFNYTKMPYLQCYLL